MGKVVTAVGIGSSPNDGTGDPARTAFGKVNDIITAILHGFFDDVDGEVNALTGKATLTSADVVMGEDSAASYAKKKFTLGNIASLVGTIFKATVNAFTKQQYFSEVELTWATSVTWNLDNAQCAHLPMEGDCAIDISNPHAGATYILRVTQDSSGGHTLTISFDYKTAGGAAFALTTDAGAEDVLTFYYNGAEMLMLPSLDFQVPA